jgi:hypothetical protein
VLRMRPELARRAMAAAGRDGIDASNLNHARLSRYYDRMALETLAAHPVAYAELSLSAFIALYFDQFATGTIASGMNPIDARIRFVPIAVALFGLAVYGVIAIYRKNRELGMTLAAILLYFTIISAGPEVGERFMIPFCAMYATAIAAGAVESFDRVYRNRALNR